MAYHLLPYNREQAYMMPPTLTEWLGEEDLAWFLIDVVGQFDLTEFYAAYRSDGWGAAAYDPSLLTTILLYAYCQGVRSSRQIAARLKRDIGFRVVAANQQPDFRTLCRFRSQHEAALEGLFVQVLALCKETGLAKLGVVAFDGTKVAANASLAANRTQASLEAEVRRMFEEAKSVDAAEDAQYGPDRQGDELPEGLGRRKERLQRLGAAKDRLEREAREKAAAEEEKARQRAAKEAEAAAKGKRLRGRKPKPQAEKRPKEPQANITDPDSRVMKTWNGYVQGYNIQAVTSEDQVLLAVAVTQAVNDLQQLVPMMERLNANLDAAGMTERPRVALADAGYASETNLTACAEAKETEWLISFWKDRKHRQMQEARACPRGRIPKGLSQRERMERKLLTKRGRRLYRRRSVIVEPPFGQMKERQGFRRFQRRGMRAAESEAVLVGTCHNLLKLWRAKQRTHLLTVHPGSVGHGSSGRRRSINGCWCPDGHRIEH